MIGQQRHTEHIDVTVRKGESVLIAGVALNNSEVRH